MRFISFRASRPWAATRFGLFLSGLLSLAVGLPVHGQGPAPRYPISGTPYWEWLLPQPTGHTLWDFHAFSDSSMIAVGSHGTAVKTRNGGRDWQVLNTQGALRDLTSVMFADSLNGWIGMETEATLPTNNRVGPGKILHTTNGGRDWAVQTIGEPTSTWAPTVAAVSPMVAYVVYDQTQRRPPNYFNEGVTTKIRRTTNGGQTWTLLSPLSADLSFPHAPRSIKFFKFFTPTFGVIFGSTENVYPEYFLLRTSDGAQSWQPLVLPTNFRARGCWFLDSQTGWVAGITVVGGLPAGPALYRTTDGGATWQALVTPPDAPREDFYEVSFADAQHGMIQSSDRSMYWTTTDGGQTWTLTQNMRIFYTTRFRLRPGGAGWWVSGVGAILRTQDYGATWPLISKTLVPLNTVRKASFPEPTRGWAFSTGVGSNSVLRTTNRGVSWQRQYLPSLVANVNWPLAGNLETAAFPDRDTAWVVGTEYSSLFVGTSLAIGTTDGGRTWTRANLPAPALKSTGVAAWTGQRIAITGAEGALHLTRNGGRTWVRVTTGTTQTLYQPVWADSLTLYASTDSSRLLRSFDAGRTWQTLTLPFAENFNGYLLSFTDARTGYYTESSDVWRTTDGGQTWTRTRLMASASFDLNGFQNSSLTYSCFRTAREGWATGNTDVFRTQDAGQTWTKLAYVGGYGSSATTNTGTLVDRYNAFYAGSGGISRYSERFLQTDSALTQTTYCTGDTVTVAFDTTGSFTANDRHFRVELSNVVGRFRPHETTILPLISPEGASPLRATLPATLASGTRYRVRIITADTTLLGSDNEHDLTINRRPAAVAVTPADSARFCAGDSVQLTAPAGFAGYRWTGGATTRSLWVTAPGPYTVEVATSSGCFGPASQPVTVRVTPRPTTPALSLNQTGTGPVLLTATPALSSPATYTWTGPNGVVTGATSATLLLTAAAQNGVYSATVTARGCVSAASATVAVVITGLAAPTDAALTVVPNPARETLRVELADASASAGLTGVVLMDPAGRIVRRLTTTAPGAALTLDVRTLPTGLYLLQATRADGRAFVRRIVIGDAAAR